jgi:hypothetical protein
LASISWCKNPCDILNESSRVFSPWAFGNENSRVLSPCDIVNKSLQVFSPWAFQNESSRVLKNLSNLRLFSMHSQDLSWQFPEFHSEYKCQAIFETCCQKEFEIELCLSSDINLCISEQYTKSSWWWNYFKSSPLLEFYTRVFLALLKCFDIIQQRNLTFVKCRELELQLKRNQLRKHDYMAYIIQVNGALPVMTCPVHVIFILLAYHIAAFKCTWG